MSAEEAKFFGSVLSVFGGIFGVYKVVKTLMDDLRKSIQKDIKALVNDESFKEAMIKDFKRIFSELIDPIEKKLIEHEYEIKILKEKFSNLTKEKNDK